MYWSTHRSPVPLDDLGWINTTFLTSAVPTCDPMMVWGTTVDVDSLEAFLASQRKTAGLLISPAHVLIQAVASALVKHPEVNRRVIGRRVHQYHGVNVVMPMRRTTSGEVDCVFLKGVDQLTLPEIAQRLWNEARQKAQEVANEQRLKQGGLTWNSFRAAAARQLRLHWIHTMASSGFWLANRLRLPTVWPWQQELNGANAFVNYLGAPGLPPMISHKPAVLPLNSYSIYVTMGPSEARPVVDGSQIVIRRQANLFCRFDHRFVNGFQAGTFMKTVRELLADPVVMTKAGGDPAVKRAA